MFKMNEDDKWQTSALFNISILNWYCLCFRYYQTHKNKYVITLIQFSQDLIPLGTQINN